MTFIELLADELNNDPIAVGYAAMTDREAADSLNAKTRQRAKPIPSIDVRRYLFIRGLWLPVKHSTAMSAEQARDALALFAEFRVQDPVVAQAVTAFLDALLADGLIAQADKDAVQAMGVEWISRAEELGLLADVNRITQHHVHKARAQPL